MKHSALLSMVVLIMFSLSSVKAESLSANQVIEKIKAKVNVPWNKNTVDTIKAGDPNTPITGIAVTFMATQEVLERAVNKKCNLIITHEPVFYNHLDQLNDLTDDPVTNAKLDYIKKHQLVIWRFHDHAHLNKPDLIDEGMIDAMGLAKNRLNDESMVFKVPSITVEKMAANIKKKLKGQSLLIVGDPKLEITGLAFSAGSPGSKTHRQLLKS